MLNKPKRFNPARDSYTKKLLFWSTNFVESYSRLLSDSKLMPVIPKRDMSTSSGRGDVCRVCGYMNNKHSYHKCTKIDRFSSGYYHDRLYVPRV